MSAHGTHAPYMCASHLSDHLLVQWVEARLRAVVSSEKGGTTDGASGVAQHLYLMGSCFRISSRLEMAYRPISSVTSKTSVVVLPTALIAENTCIVTDTRSFPTRNVCPSARRWADRAMAHGMPRTPQCYVEAYRTMLCGEVAQLTNHWLRHCLAMQPRVQ